MFDDMFSLLFPFGVLFSTILTLEYDMFYNKHIDVEEMKSFPMLSLKMCVRECMRLGGCSSVNFDSFHLQCYLLSMSHLNESLEKNNEMVFINVDKDYALCNKECRYFETCIKLKNGNEICIKTECSDTKPAVTGVLEESFDPPFIQYNVTDPLTSSTMIMSSTCIPGKPWSYNNLICVGPQSILEYGNVTMSSIYQSIDEFLDDYSIDSNTSWSSSDHSGNAWIQVELSSIYNVTAVLTKGRSNKDQWVTSYYVLYLKESTSTWIQLSNVFNGNSDRNTLVSQTFEGGIITRGIRLQPKTWYEHASLRFDVLGCRQLA